MLCNLHEIFMRTNVDHGWCPCKQSVRKYGLAGIGTGVPVHLVARHRVAA